jgi:hypothetical protein
MQMGRTSGQGQKAGAHIFIDFVEKAMQQPHREAAR